MNAAQIQIDWDMTFFRGAKSDQDPSSLPQGYYFTGLNMLNVGGVLSTRPGYNCVVKLADGRLQGAALFRPILGLEQILVAIQGQVFVSTFPFETFALVPNITLSPSAKQVFWAQCLQAAMRTSPGLVSAITLIPPKAIMFITDGAESAPAWYDGANAGQVSGNSLDTPGGGPMAWVGDRLWIGRDNQVFASDIANPFSFRERVYLGGSESFYFNGEVTALVPTPSVESPQLFVFTAQNGSIIQANIRDRTQWPITPDFQSEVIQVGCRAPRSAKSHYGHLIWFSQSGVAIYDPATSGKLTARLPVRDNEMLASKAYIDNDVSLVAGGTFGQFFMMSVPSEDIFNKHTWVMNNASFATLNDDSGPSWAGLWTGTRPVEWVCGEIAGVERAFYVSVDVDGHNRLWEAFQPNRLDNGCPITWAVETRSHFGITSSNPQKPPGSRCRLTWMDVALAGVPEDLDIAVFFAGGPRGAYRPMLTKQLSIQRGSLDSGQEITMASSLFAFKPQSRVVRTEDANNQAADPLAGSCGVERIDNDNVDESFQFLIVGHGPATIRWIRSFAYPVPEDTAGDGLACSDETRLNAVRFDGVAAAADDIGSLIAELSTATTQGFFSNQTQVLRNGDFSAVGVGSAESIVSQKAADRVATIVATQQAQAELDSVVPPVLSVGLGL
jgi:hypothetical protein